MMTILGENNFEIEVLISESDIAKVSKDDQTKITLDAYGDDVEFQGKVFFIEPAETVIQNVIYYKVIVNFDPGEQNVKSGMTANVLLTTNEKNDILVIPARAIIDRNSDNKTVKVFENNEVIEKQVNLGLEGDNGLVEIISGLKDADNIITSN
jgi:multidrug efflux pump subunit AcrA (membrane-fusion protein)